jgi:hypothetical protein
LNELNFSWVTHAVISSHITRHMSIKIHRHFI